MEDILQQLQKELRLLREEREKDKVIRLALEKRLQEAGILEAPVQEQGQVIADEVDDQVDANEEPEYIEVESSSDTGYVSAGEEEEDGTQGADHTLQSDIHSPAVSPKPEPASPRGPSQVGINTPSKPTTKDHPILCDMGTSDSVIMKAKKHKANADPAAFTLSATRRAQYMEGALLFTITPPAPQISLSRAALNDEYKCTTMGLLWRSPKGAKLQYLFPTYELNPDMPRGPGEPGLLLGCRDELWKYGPWTLFYHHTDSKAVRMGYAGEYKCQVVGTISKEEFTSYGVEVKRSWADKIATRVRYECYVEIRARITLRKYNPGEEPTQEEVKAKVAEIKKRNRSSPPELTHEDVIAAFTRGEESIKVMRVECVKYDHDKAQEYLPLQRKFEEKKKRNGSVKNQTISAAKPKSKASNSHKRAISLSDVSESSGGGDRDAEAEDSDGSSNERLPKSKLKGVELRPIKRARNTPSHNGQLSRSEDVNCGSVDSTPQRPIRERKKSFKARQCF